MSYNNPVPNDKMLDLFKLEALADDKINVTEKLKYVIGMVETLWEKEKMLITSIFFFFPHWFQKPSLLSTVVADICEW